MRPTYWMIRHVKRRVFGGASAFVREFGSWRRFWRSWRRYRSMAPGDVASMHLYPCLGDDTAETPIDAVYYYQDAWAFEKIVQAMPASHVDVGSHHKFVALLSKVVPVTMVDLRPLALPLDSLRFLQGSILALPFPDASLASLSSLCVVEHIGLGRYGDPLDPLGSVRAIAELKRVVAPGGDLYISVPVDDENRIFFNAHRAFAEKYLMDLFAPFEVLERRYIERGRFGESRTKGFGVACYHLRNRA